MVLDSETELTPVPLPDTTLGEITGDYAIAFSNNVRRCHDLLGKLGSCNNKGNDCDDKRGQGGRVLHR